MWISLKLHLNKFLDALQRWSVYISEKNNFRVQTSSVFTIQHDFFVTLCEPHIVEKLKLMMKFKMFLNVKLSLEKKHYELRLTLTDVKSQSFTLPTIFSGGKQQEF